MSEEKKPLAVVVTGGRDFAEPTDLDYVLDCLKPDLVIHGACETGADDFAEKWAKRRQRDYRGYPAKWGKGRSAGPIRNSRMLDELLALQPEYDIAVVHCKGGSGTADMVGKAENAGVKLYAVED